MFFYPVILRLQCSLFVLSCLYLCLGQFARSALPPIVTAHPRLYISPDSLSSLRSFTLHPDRVEFFDRTVRYVDRRLAELPVTLTTLQTSDYPQRISFNTAITVLIQPEEPYLSMGRLFLETMAGVDPDVAWDTGTRYRLLSMALLYDYLHWNLTESEKQYARDGMYAHLDRCREFVDNPYFVGGHSKLGNLVVMGAAIAVLGEDDGVRFESVLETVLSNWVDGFNPVMEKTGEGGSHYMGWSYGTPYSRIESVIMWYFASVAQELWLESYVNELPFFYIYAADRTGKAPVSGDCYSTSILGDGPLAIASASSAFTSNQYAEAFYQVMFSDAWEAHTFFRILLRMESYELETSIGNPHAVLASLPYSRIFMGSGFYILRNTWDFVNEDSVVFVFKSTPFRSHNHHHYDQNGFTLNFRGTLLCDSGSYDSYGTSHWHNFFIRTIAHNSLVVHLEGEEPHGSSYSNDGGQIVVSTARTVEELENEDALDGIIAASTANHGRVGYVCGDATRAYSPEKLNLFQRSVLTTTEITNWQFPVILLVDSVQLTSETLVPRLLYHTKSDPIITDRLAYCDNRDGTSSVRMEFLYPPNAGVEKIGGTQRFVVDGVDYPPSSEPVEEAICWGRIEVSMQDPLEKNFTFVSLLAVGNSSYSEMDLPPSEVVVVQNENGVVRYAGVLVSGALFVLVPPSNQEDYLQIRSLVLDPLPSQEISDLFVAGAKPNSCIGVTIGSDRHASRYAYVSDAEGLMSHSGEKCDGSVESTVTGILLSLTSAAFLLVVVVVIFVLSFRPCRKSGVDKGNATDDN